MRILQFRRRHFASNLFSKYSLLSTLYLHFRLQSCHQSNRSPLGLASKHHSESRCVATDTAGHGSLNASFFEWKARGYMNTWDATEFLCCQVECACSGTSRYVSWDMLSIYQIFSARLSNLVTTSEFQSLIWIQWQPISSCQGKGTANGRDVPSWRPRSWWNEAGSAPGPDCVIAHRRFCEPGSAHSRGWQAHESRPWASTHVPAVYGELDANNR